MCFAVIFVCGFAFEDFNNVSIILVETHHQKHIALIRNVLWCFALGRNI